MASSGVIARVKAGARDPATVLELISHVDQLSPQQLADLRREHGLAAPYYLKPALVEKLNGQRMLPVLPPGPVLRSLASRPIANGHQNKLIDVPDIRQPNNFACGACAAACVGRYFGVGPIHVSEWEKALGTSLEKSTNPQAIVDYLRNLGLEVEARDGMTIQDLAGYTARGFPVICCVQDYGNQREPGATFLYGHYLTVVGIGMGMIFAQDSSIENVEDEPGGDVPKKKAVHSGNIAVPGRIMIEEQTWLKVWHDIDADGHRFIHFGIAVGPPVSSVPRQEPVVPLLRNQPAIAAVPSVPSLPDHVSLADVLKSVYARLEADALAQAEAGKPVNLTHHEAALVDLLTDALAPHYLHGAGAIREQRKRFEAMTKAWEESEHRRGQPGNAGQFGPGGNAVSKKEPEGEDRKYASREDYEKNGTKAEAFKAWFGDWEKDPASASKVVNKDTGEPQVTHGTGKVVFHGTIHDFEAFDKAKQGMGVVGKGFYFAEDQRIADNFAKDDAGKTGKVLSVYLDIKNPYDLGQQYGRQQLDAIVDAAAKTDTAAGEAVKGALAGISETASGYKVWLRLKDAVGTDRINCILQKAGFDGVTHEASDDAGSIFGRLPNDKREAPYGLVWVAFEPAQIKSTDNNGTFDSGDPHFRKHFVLHAKAVGTIPSPPVTWYGSLTRALAKIRELAGKLVGSIIDTVTGRANTARADRQAEMDGGHELTPLEGKVVMPADHAQSVAEDEGWRAHQAGQVDAAEEGGAVKLRWVALPGCCKLCADLDGQERAPGEAFHVDPRGGPYAAIYHPGAHPSCRCTLSYSYDDGKSFVNIGKAWDESEHHRGQPGNAGQFGSGGNAVSGKEPEEEKSPSPQSVTPAEKETAKKAAVAIGDNKKRIGADGTTYIRAPKGGAKSDVNGEHYHGGQWMPIHGLSEKKPSKKEDQSPVNEGSQPPKPNENAAQRAPRQPMTPEQIAEEKERREDGRKWGEMNTGILGRLKWLGENPNSKAIEHAVIDLRKWKEYAAEIGETKLRMISDTLKEQWNAHVDQELAADAAAGHTAPQENADWYRNGPERRAGEDSQEHGAKKLLKTMPSLYVARQYIQAAIENAKDVSGLYAVEQILQDIVKGSSEKSWDESAHPRGHEGNPGQFGSGGSSETASDTADRHEADSYLEAFNSGAPATADEVNIANAELDQADVPYRVMPKEDGAGFEVRHFDDLADEYGDNWTVARNPETGKLEAGDADYFHDLEGELTADPGRWAAAFNGRADLEQDDIDAANTALVEADSDVRLVPGDDGQWQVLPVDDIESEYGEDWSIWRRPDGQWEAGDSDYIDEQRGKVLLRGWLMKRAPVIQRKDFAESEHPRGQPGNAGQFGPGGAKVRKKKDEKKSAKKPAPAAKKPATGGVKEQAASIVGGKIKLTKERAFNGEPVEAGKIGKQLAGAIGEEVLIAFIKHSGFPDAGYVNDHVGSKMTNLAGDLIHDHEVIEAKTGQVSNSKKAQQWRLTFNANLGKKEAEKLANATPEQLAAVNKAKQQAIHDRKQKLLNDLSEKLGRKVEMNTMTVLLNPDTQTADIYKFTGVHDRLDWNSDMVKSAYVGSVKYGK